MADLTVLVSPASERDMLANIADWSACGLIRDLIWVDQAPDRVDARVAALRLSQGELTGVSLADEVIRLQPELVRLVFTVPALPGSQRLTYPQEKAVVDLVTRASGSARVVVIRMVVAIDQVHCVQAEIGLNGAHNLILTGETSVEPGAAAPLPPDASPAEISRHAALGLVVLGGLWHKADSGPFDQTRTASRWPRLFRAYVRDVSWDAVESQLRAAALATASKNPLPTAQGGSTHISDQAQATSDFAQTLLGEHQHLLRSARAKPALEGVKEVGFFESLRMLFSFFASAWNPVAWVRAQLAAAVDSAAASMTKAIFGEDSRFRIGIGASIEDRAQALATISEGLNRGRPKVHEPVGDFAPLWRDFADGALTLLDGGERSSVLPPIQVGSQTGVLHRAAQCAPGQSDDFVLTPAAGTYRVTRVSASDYLRFVELATALQSKAADPDESVAATELDRLKVWRNQHEAAYTVQVGTRLGKWIERLSKEIDGYLSQLTPVPDEMQDLAAGQRRLRWWLLALLVLAVGGIGVVGMLGLSGALRWPTAGAIGATAAVGWLVSSLAVFSYGQRRLFGELNRRRELVSQRESLERNLRAALNDLRRSMEAYRQFLLWADIVAVVVGAPFGKSEPDASDDLPGIRGLPANARLGRLVVAEGDRLQLAARLRRDYFRTGWLGDVWVGELAQIGVRLGPDGIDFMDEPERIFRAASDADGPLQKWSESLGKSGAGDQARQRAWQRMSAALEGLEGHRIEALGRIAETGKPEAAFGDFLKRIKGDDAANLDDRLLLPQAVVDGVHEVRAKPWLHESTSGLGRSVVRVEFGEAFSPDLVHGVEGEFGVPPPRRRGGLV